MLILNITLVLSYLLGSINSAIILCKLTGLGDPRLVGSGNPGATNVMRLGSKKIAGLVLFFDGLKGFVPVMLAHALGVSGFWLGLVYLFAVLGHIFPVFFHFKGGKGVATALGGLIALDWLAAIAVGLIWGATAAVYRYSSLAAIVAFGCMPLILLWHNPSYFVPACFAAIVLVIKHKDNLRRLANGEEPKIGSKKANARAN